jgi:hypothetical protein
MTTLHLYMRHPLISLLDQLRWPPGYNILWLEATSKYSRAQIYNESRKMVHDTSEENVIGLSMVYSSLLRSLTSLAVAKAAEGQKVCT